MDKIIYETGGAEYDGLFFTDKPSAASNGTTYMPMIYDTSEYELVVGGVMPTQGEVDDALEDPNGHIGHNLRDGSYQGLVALDIEIWYGLVDDESTQGEHEDTCDLYVELLTKIKAAAHPGVQFGYYGISPLRRYFPSVDSPSHTTWAGVQAINDYYQPLSDLVDWSMPNLYTFYRGRDAWEQYATRHIAEARRLCPNKPVIPLLWMQYHDSIHKLISYSYFYRQLDLCRKLGDGIALWGGVDLNLGGGFEGQRLAWDEDAGWWKATKHILAAEPVRVPLVVA